MSLTEEQIQMYRSVFTSQYEAFVPLKQRGMNFPMQPSDLSTAPKEFQAEAIKCVEERWKEGIAFFGASGTGKTSLMAGMFRKRVVVAVGELPFLTICNIEGRKHSLPLWKLSVTRLVEEHHAHITHDLGDKDYVDVRIVTRERIERAAKAVTPQWPTKPGLFLEEFDKLGTLTEHKYDVIYGIVNATDENCVQLALTTNLKPSEFEEYFGGKIARRVLEKCWRIDYFEASIKPPKVQVQS